VIRTRVGYAGGTADHPTYHALGDHSESIEVTYDPAVIGYEQLLDVFWDTHNPNVPELSHQYRSAIFVADDQRSAAEASLASHPHAWTTIEPAGTFWQAEDYHQKYRLRGVPELYAEFHSIYPDDHDFVKSTAVARVNSWLSGHTDMAQVKAEIDEVGLDEHGKQVLLDILE
jgi:peptide-methionine (S)-S-oxide reductase